MAQNKRLKLINILNNNTSWPIILENVSSKDFETSVVLPANINSSELGIKIDDKGLCYPSWLNNIKKQEGENTILLVIDKLDEISFEEQEKFYGIIKYKGVNGYKFPSETQIIITVKNKDNVSKKISSLCLSYKVE
ncbi:MAG: hypothetical protein E7359_02050 [Clostridiales bacterium]|nr:hypothetical protein [Clostridiales bacterium]